VCCCITSFVLGVSAALLVKVEYALGDPQPFNKSILCAVKFSDATCTSKSSNQGVIWVDSEASLPPCDGRDMGE
jgi:hypothetical protein